MACFIASDLVPNLNSHFDPSSTDPIQIKTPVAVGAGAESNLNLTLTIFDNLLTIDFQYRL
jgi:hypothetical protein